MFTRRFAAVAAVLALAAAGAGAAFAAHGGGGIATRPGFGHHGGGPLAAAATYLGLNATDLRTQLEAGKTLAQIADGTSGKSAAGLVDALVADAKTKLDAAVTAGKLTQTQEDSILAKVKTGVTALVNGTRPKALPGHHDGGPLAAAATYLGLDATDLRTQLQSGKTLAQIADGTSGKSAAGLVDALVADAKTKLDAAVTAGKLTQPQEDAILGELKQHVTDLVNGVRPTGPPPAGHWGGPHGAHHGMRM